MREIKFRFWDLKAKKFFYDAKELYLKNSRIYDIYEDYGGLFTSGLKIDDVTDRFIPQQYTGLTDKNGKEIYEGDILRFDPDIRDLMGSKCIYSNLGHVWIYSLADGVTISYNHPYSEMSDSWSDIVARGIGENRPLSYEVAGNIMENPELLNVS
jgi:uncharacterized phage protein (TIGR01671 family)